MSAMSSDPLFHGDYTEMGVRILRDLCRYCQGTGMIASSLLLLMEEEDAFWMLSTIVEDILPASYYSSTLLGKSSLQNMSPIVTVTMVISV